MSLSGIYYFCPVYVMRLSLLTHSYLFIYVSPNSFLFAGVALREVQIGGSQFRISTVQMLDRNVWETSNPEEMGGTRHQLARDLFGQI